MVRKPLIRMLFPIVLLVALASMLTTKALEAVAIASVPRTLLGALIVLALAVAASCLAARRATDPLLKLKSAASRFAAGEFASRAPVPDIEELASLADTLNTMAEQLDRQMKTISRQAEEQRAILAGMKEGVIAVDMHERLLILNPSAEGLLGLTLESAEGRPMHDVIRHPDLQHFIEGASAGPEPAIGEIVIHTPLERVLQVAGATLSDAGGRQIGALVVLNDVTEMRRLESVRREFVANVSHELRTPITSIKGFVETLRNGAAKDPEQAQEFLGIVMRQADRLNSIIEDLLTLSTIEQSAGTASIALQSMPVRAILRTAIEDCQLRAQEFDVATVLKCKSDLRAQASGPLLEQAVTNLLDNAIKYSPGGKVSVSAERDGDEVVISIADTGCGIDPEHIPRLFERFYRVDKARSRKLGGTGLGLAIVKHIVQAHQGRIEVESATGEGSTFRIHLRSATPAKSAARSMQ